MRWWIHNMQLNYIRFKNNWTEHSRISNAIAQCIGPFTPDGIKIVKAEPHVHYSAAILICCHNQKWQCLWTFLMFPDWFSLDIRRYEFYDGTVEWCFGKKPNYIFTVWKNYTQQALMWNSSERYSIKDSLTLFSELDAVFILVSMFWSLHHIWRAQTVRVFWLILFVKYSISFAKNFVKINHLSWKFCLIVFQTLFVHINLFFFI